MTLSPQEVAQYIRLTLKEHGVADVKVSWIDSKRVRGLAYGEEARIELAFNCLCSFRCFRETLIHEICHIKDFRKRGNTFFANKKHSFHGKSWKKLCAAAGIPARLVIPE